MRAAVFLFAVAVAPAAAGEREATDRLCAGMEREVATGGGSRADCADGERAYEVDYSGHWHQALGQALYYGRTLRLRPTVVLLCKDARTPADLDGPFAQTCREHAFRAEYGASGMADVLLCAEAAADFDDCRTGGD